MVRRRRGHFLGSLGHSRRSIQGMRVSLFHLSSHGLPLIDPSIVEFANSEDARRAKEDLADKQLLGRPVFIREVSSRRLEQLAPQQG